MTSLFEKHGWLKQGDFWVRADTNISYKAVGFEVSLYRDGKPTGTKWDLENPKRLRALEKHVAANSKPPKTWEDEVRAGFERILKIFKSVVEREKRTARRGGNVSLEELYPGDYFAYGNDIYQVSWRVKDKPSGKSVAQKGPDGSYVPRVPDAPAPWRVFKPDVKVLRVEFRVVE